MRRMAEVLVGRRRTHWIYFARLRQEGWLWLLLMLMLLIGVRLLMRVLVLESLLGVGRRSRGIEDLRQRRARHDG